MTSIALRRPEVTLRSKVDTWLTETRIRHKEAATPGTAWHLVIEDPNDPSWTLSLIQPEGQDDRVDIVAATHLNEQQRATLRQMTLEDRVAFNRTLSDELLGSVTTVDYDFGSGTADDPLDNGEILQGFVLRSELFTDGLSKSRFFDRIRAVEQKRAAGVRRLRIALGGVGAAVLYDQNSSYEY